MANVEWSATANILIAAVYSIGAILAIRQMQMRTKKSDAIMPGVMSAFWLLGLAIFSLAVGSVANFLLVDIYQHDNFPSVADLFNIVGYLGFLIFLLRLLFPGEANMWLATVAAAAILSFQALLLQYIVTIRADVPMSVILQFMYILLGFTFSIITIYLSRRHNDTPAKMIMLSLGVFSLSQLAGNWFFSSSISVGGTALAQSKELGAILVRAASALTIGLGVPLGFATIEGWSAISPGRLMHSRPFQLAVCVFALVVYLVISTIYLVSTNLVTLQPNNLTGGTESLLRDNMISAQGAFQIYLIFAIVLGYSQSSLRRQEFEERIIQMNKELDRTVAERTEELKKRLVELEKFKKLVIGRELKMVELKKKVGTLEIRLFGKKVGK